MHGIKLGDVDQCLSNGMISAVEILAHLKVSTTISAGGLSDNADHRVILKVFLRTDAKTSPVALERIDPINTIMY